ncbi:MAG TPA: hypothetical protein VIA29_06410 [Thermoanaerobaculia bacterium]
MRPPSARAITAAAVAAAAILLSLQLLVPPIVGLANNADFEKVMGYVGLQYRTDVPAERYFGWILREFDRVTPGWYRSGYHTSETLLTAAARLFTEPFARDGVFDIRILGALHAALLCLGIGLLVLACKDLVPPAQILTGALLVLFFTDVGYAAVLNTLYSQAASLVFLLLTAGVAAISIRRGGLEGFRVPAYFLCALLFVLAKPQHALQGLPLALLGWRIATPAARRGAGLLAAALLLASAVSYVRAPRIIRNVALYHTVFYEMLPHSPDPAADLAALGLDPDLIALSHQSAYEKDSPIWTPEFSARFFDRYGYGDLLRFYLARPGRLAALLQRASLRAFTLRPQGFGNFEKSLGLPARATTSRFSLWSSVRKAATPAAVPAIVLLLGGTIAWCAAGWRHASPRGRLVRESLAVLAAMAGLEFLVCALANAAIELDRQLFAFQAMCDLLLIAALTATVSAATARASSRSRPSLGRSEPE